MNKKYTTADEMIDGIMEDAVSLNDIADFGNLFQNESPDIAKIKMRMLMTMLILARTLGKEQQRRLIG